MGRLPLNISREITASTLYMGMMTAIKMEASPAAVSPNRAVLMGMPKSTKLLRNMPWSITPRRELSFSSRMARHKESTNWMSTPATAYSSSWELKLSASSVL